MNLQRGASLVQLHNVSVPKVVVLARRFVFGCIELGWVVGWVGLWVQSFHFLLCDYAKHIHMVLLSTSVCPSVCLSLKRVYCDKTKAPSEKSSIMTNRKSLTNFRMSLRWTSYVAPNPPKGASRATSRLWRVWKWVYDLDLIEIGLSALYGFSIRPWFQYYAAVARSLCDSKASCLALAYKSVYQLCRLLK